MNLRDHTILITGGTSGIGKALAEQLQTANTVIITGRNEELLNMARAKGFKAIACDLSQLDQLDHLVMTVEQEFPELDILINNAGIQYNYLFPDETDISQKISHEIQVNLTGTIQLTHKLLPVLSTKKSMIVNVTSGLGAVPKSDGLVYSVSKAGLRNFTRGLKKVLKNLPIQVFEVIPPVTDTNMTSGRNEAKMSTEDLVRIILQQWKKGRKLIAPGKIRLLFFINRIFPGLADKIIN